MRKEIGAGDFKHTARQRVCGKGLFLLAGLVYLARLAGSDRGGDVAVHAGQPDGLPSATLRTLHALMLAVKGNKSVMASLRSYDNARTFQDETIVGRQVVPNSPVWTKLWRKTRNMRREAGKDRLQ